MDRLRSSSVPATTLATCSQGKQQSTDPHDWIPHRFFFCVFLVFLLGRFAVFHAPFRCRNGLFEGTHRNLMICLVLVVVLDAISILVFWLHFHRPVNPRRCLVVLVKMAATCRSSRPPPVRMRALAATRYKHENTRPAKAIDIH